MNTNQINKKEPCYTSDDNRLSMTSSQESHKVRNQKFLKALQTLAEQDPEGFSSVAPELIKRSVWNWRGADPFFAERLSNWLETAHKWSEFKEILPKDAHMNRRKVAVIPQIKNLPREQALFLEKLTERFSGDHSRWDASKRDQFTILGMLALEGKAGVPQGRLVHYLGLGEPGDGGLPGSNAIRAAKIALSRSSKPLTLWAPASGNGSQRMHSFADATLAEMVARFVLTQPAAILLPPSTSLES
ncbi:MAG: hypothetical protein CMA63_01870 [Euryarchaeota archaeon]|nr:hypothetical protein [Euryarchaeota archaeon]|tara:strand:+ start:1365 stop:2099 length:735 start_codon:yes stop_codon:yes gene_type:complete